MRNTIKVAFAATAIVGSLAGCADVQPGAARYPSPEAITADVAQWRIEAYDDLTAVSEAFRKLEETSRAGDVPGIERSCQELNVKLNGVYRWYVTPKGAASVETKAAFDAYRAAADECSKISAVTDFIDTASLLQEGNDHLAKAKAILDGTPVTQ